MKILVQRRALTVIQKEELSLWKPILFLEENHIYPPKACTRRSFVFAAFYATTNNNNNLQATFFSLCAI